MHQLDISYRRKLNRLIFDSFEKECLPVQPCSLRVKDMDSTQSADVNAWFSRCLHEHNCEKDRTPGFLPTRVLECAKESVKLILTKNLSKSHARDIRYAPLSYCWEPSPLQLKLTTHNYSALQKGITTESFAQNLLRCCPHTRGNESQLPLDRFSMHYPRR